MSKRTEWKLVDECGNVLTPGIYYSEWEITTLLEAFKILEYRVDDSASTKSCTVIRSRIRDLERIEFLESEIIPLLSKNELLTLLIILENKIENPVRYGKGYAYIMNFLHVQRAIPFEIAIGCIKISIRRELKI